MPCRRSFSADVSQHVRNHIESVLGSVSTEHKQACDRSHDKLKGAYEGLADTEQTDVCPETAIEKDNQKRDGDRQ